MTEGRHSRVAPLNGAPACVSVEQFRGAHAHLRTTLFTCDGDRQASLLYASRLKGAPSTQQAVEPSAVSVQQSAVTGQRSEVGQWPEVSGRRLAVSGQRSVQVYF